MTQGSSLTSHPREQHAGCVQRASSQSNSESCLGLRSLSASPTSPAKLIKGSSRLAFAVGF